MFVSFKSQQKRKEEQRLVRRLLLITTLTFLQLSNGIKGTLELTVDPLIRVTDIIYRRRRGREPLYLIRVTFLSWCSQDWKDIVQSSYQRGSLTLESSSLSSFGRLLRQEDYHMILRGNWINVTLYDSSILLIRKRTWLSWCFTSQILVTMIMEVGFSSLLFCQIIWKDYSHLLITFSCHSLSDAAPLVSWDAFHVTKRFGHHLLFLTLISNQKEF
jgi:hypothetical protein